MRPAATVPHPAELPGAWRLRAQLFREHDETSVAAAYEKCADDLEQTLRLESETPLTLEQAAEESGSARRWRTGVCRQSVREWTQRSGPTGPLWENESPASTRNARRGKGFDEWAWDDSNVRPHAYQASMKVANFRQ